jgi:phosphatidylglycerol---prolipoprotein diacylglyceryl transferase
MKPRIVEFLNQYFHSGIFSYLIPDPSVVYSVMLGVGAIIFIKRCGRLSLDKFHAAGFAIWASVSALIGARLFYLIQNIGYTLSHPGILLEINGATVSFGVYLGGMLGALLYCRYNKLSPWNYLDTAASVLGIGPLIGRMACFLNGDDYGTLSNLPWAVRFPHGSYPFIHHVENGWIDAVSDLSLPVHPVQLYGCLKGLVLLILFTVLWRKNIFKPGVLFFLFCMAYSLFRFILEFFRGDDDRGWVGSLSTGQFMSILIFCAAALFILFKYKLKITNEFAVEISPSD